MEETDIVDKNNELPVIVDPATRLAFTDDAIMVDVIRVLP